MWRCRNGALVSFGKMTDQRTNRILRPLANDHVDSTRLDGGAVSCTYQPSCLLLDTRIRAALGLLRRISVLPVGLAGGDMISSWKVGFVRSRA